MQQSEDIVIYDTPNPTTGTTTITTNSTTLKFDDILEQSDKMVKTAAKKPKSKSKIASNNIKLAKDEQKLMKTIENELQEPERQNLIHIIQKYQSSERFGTFIRSELKITYTAEALSKKTIPQLQSILDKIRLHLDNQNLNKIYDSVLFSSTAFIETMSKPIGVNVDGFSTLLLENEEFLNCWERIKCETVMPTVPSHIQMIFILGQTYFLAYAINKQKDYKAPPEVQEVIDEVLNENETKTNESKEKEDIIEKPKLENGMTL